MKIDFQKNKEVLSVTLEGRLDTTTAPALESFLCEHYEGRGAIVIDCEKLTYVSSAGLRVLLAAQKKSKGTLKLTHVCELVMEVFEMTGFVDIFEIE